MTARRRPAGEAGDLSTFLAALLTLPLLLLTLFGGSAVLHLFQLSQAVAQAEGVGLQVAAMEGGVGPPAIEAIDQAAAAAGIDPRRLEISGTPPPVAWGGDIRLTVLLRVHPLAPFSAVPGLGPSTVTLGGTSHAVSLVPPG